MEVGGDVPAVCGYVCRKRRDLATGSERKCKSILIFVQGQLQDQSPPGQCDQGSDICGHDTSI